MDKNSKTLVDLGCAERATIKRLLKIDKKFNYLSHCYKIGADIFLPYILHVRHTYDDCLLCDVRHLPFRKRSVDIILCLDVIEHLKKSEGKALIKSIEEIAHR